MITSILRCPIGGNDLVYLDDKNLNKLNIQIIQNELVHPGGQPVRMKLENALVSADGRYIYPVVDGILILLPRLAITRREQAETGDSQKLAPETDDVMRFYDEVGWQSGKNDNFQDAVKFEDLRPVSRDYIHKCHLRVSKHISHNGKYLLDAASGPVQYPEYLTYSEGYERRICADVSITALKTAREKLGDKGVYIQCDITRLPFKDESVEGFVSLHTIYHVPAEKQITAFRELERVLMTDHTGVVVYTWGAPDLKTRLKLAYYRSAHRMKRLLHSIVPAFPRKSSVRNADTTAPADITGAASAGSTTSKVPSLYFHPHDYNWFQQNIGSRTGWDIKVWRSVSVPFLKRYMHTGLLGGFLLSILFRLENIFPDWFGRFGKYPMLIYAKANPTNKK